MTDGSDFGLGQRFFQDPRSRAYQVFPMLMGAGDTEPLSRTWGLGDQLNQGSSGRCVTYTGAAEGGAAPVRWPATQELADILYRITVLHDVWTENDNGDIHFGTNDVALMKVLRALGFITEFRWTGAGSGQALADHGLALSHLGPVMTGTDWLSSMDQVGPDGHIVVDPASTYRGGHEYLHYRVQYVMKPGTPTRTVRPRVWDDVDLDVSRSYIRNSWGGVCNGWMTLREVGLLQQGIHWPGTGVIPIKRTRTT